METENKYLLEHKISQLILNDNKCSTHFEYIQPCYQQSNNKLNIVTYNHTHNQHFLLCSASGNSFLECLKSAYEYISKICRKEIELNSYTVSWASKIEGSHSRNSYFYGENIFEVLKKFYFDKNEADFIIHSILLNPIS